MGGGLQRICKMYGSIRAGDVTWVWDYASDCAVHEAEMLVGSERWKKSERAKAELVRAALSDE